MKTEKVKPPLKEQPQAQLLVATAKVIEALDPLISYSQRRKALIAALAIISEETLMTAVQNAH